MYDWREISERVEELLQRPFQIQEAHPLSGGDINDVFTLSTHEEKYVIKLNSRKRYPGMFKKEAAGLSELKKGTLRVPNVQCSGDMEEVSFLLIEYVESSAPNNFFNRNLGKGLAELHDISSDCFGFESDNYIGSLIQSNGKCDNWEEFFISKRIEPQFRMAFDKGIIGNDYLNRLNAFEAAMRDYWPEEPPSLLHGDLWSGNLIVEDKGEPCLLDPAVYYGHREMELAMMKLFGGFDNEVYRNYNETRLLEKGWEERIPVGQLYYMLVHLNLFGTSYLRSVDACLRHVKA